MGWYMAAWDYIIGFLFRYRLQSEGPNEPVVQ